MKRLLALQAVPPRLLLPLLLFALAFLPVGPAGAQPRPSAAESAELTKTITRLDGELFDAYNRCDLAKLGALTAEDLEFYHDKDGLSRGRQALVVGVRKNICGKVRRDLVAGTLEVFPLHNYGAVEIGTHRFCDTRKYKTCGTEDSGIAKFVMLWQNRDGVWQLSRVISFDHASSDE